MYVVYGHGFWIGRFSGELNMQKFREFELLVRPNNTDVYLWQFDGGMESIGKVRHSGNDVKPIDKSAFQAV